MTYSNQYKDVESIIDTLLILDSIVRREILIFA